MPAAYAELHCLSNFTFLRGASHPEELVARATELGYSALAITDECSMAGVVRAHVAASRVGLKLIIGTELALEDGPKLVLLARNREGYGNLCALATRGRRAAKKGAYRLLRADLDGGVPDCLALWLPAEEEAVETGRWLAERFPGRLWIAVKLLANSGDRRQLERLQSLGRTLGLPCTASGDVHMHVRERRRLQDTLTAIRLGVPVSKVGYRLHANGERHLRAREALERIYPRELLEETVRIARRCEFSLAGLRYEYPQELVPAGTTPAEHLRRLTDAGLKQRYPEGVPGEVRKQAEEELGLIAELRYEPFFLTVHDIVRHARSLGIL